MKWLRTLSAKQIRIIVMFMTIVVALLIFEEVVDDVFSDPMQGDPETLVFDKTILQLLSKWRSPTFNQVMVDITAMGSFSVILLFTLILTVFVITRKDWKGLYYIFVLSLGPSFIPLFLKNHYMRARPDFIEKLVEVKTHSFPSGHSFGATVAYFGLAFLVSREIKGIKVELLYFFLAAVVVSLVALSRMYLGVHYPTDIVAGICLGIVWVMVVSIPFTYLKRP